MELTAKHSPANTLYSKIYHSTLSQSLLLAAIISVGVVLRFYKLGQWSFWIEEYHTLNHIHLMNTVPGFVYSDVRPFFYFLIWPLFNTVEITEWSARLIPTLFGILTIPAVYWLTKKLFDTPVALLAAALVALSPWHIYWSQNARFYSLFLLLFNLSLFAFYWGIETNRFRYIALSLLALVLSVATHTLGILLIPLCVLYFVLVKWLPLEEKPPGLRLINISPYFLLPLLGYLSYELVRVFILGDIPLAAVMYRNYFNEDTSHFLGYETPWIMLTAVLYFIETPVALLAAAGSFYLLYQRRRIGLILSIGAFVPFLLFIVLTAFASTANRYVFMTLPNWLILAAFAIKHLSLQVYTNPRHMVWLLGILVLLVRDPVSRDWLYYFDESMLVRFTSLLAVGAYIGGMVWLWRSERRREGIWLFTTLFIVVAHVVFANTLYYTYHHGHRDDWKALSTALEQKAPDMSNNLILTSNILMVDYYLGAERVHIKDIDDPDSLAEIDKDLWFVEDLGVDQTENPVFKRWARANCTAQDAWDHFMVGRVWKMRLYRCLT